MKENYFFIITFVIFVTITFFLSEIFLLEFLYRSVFCFFLIQLKVRLNYIHTLLFPIKLRTFLKSFLIISSYLFAKESPSSNLFPSHVRLLLILLKIIEFIISYRWAQHSIFSARLYGLAKNLILIRQKKRDSIFCVIIEKFYKVL